MNNPEHGRYMIHDALQSSNCSMIVPWHRYKDNENDRPQKIERKEENFAKLETTISQEMKTINQKYLVETLENTKPVLYIDCSQKWDLDIMLYILKEYEKRVTVQDKTELLGHIIWTRTVITEPPQRKEYTDKEQPNSEEMIHHYNTLLQQKLAEIKPEHIENVLNFESDIAITGLARFMEEEKKRHMYLYLDNTKELSIGEQMRINLLLYARWWIDHDKWIHLKINNWSKSRKTRTASNGQRVESTHDYSETGIYEDDLDQTI